MNHQQAKLAPTISIRWLIRKDLPAVMAIEGMSFVLPWTEDDFHRCLCTRNCIGMVAVTNDLVTGYMIYALHKTRIEVLNFAVHPDFRRMGIGGRMVEKLKWKSRGTGHVRTITLVVSERNLRAQMFFRSHGFRAIEVIRDRDAGDQYLMGWNAETVVAN